MNLPRGFVRIWCQISVFLFLADSIDNEHAAAVPQLREAMA